MEMYNRYSCLPSRAKEQIFCARGSVDANWIIQESRDSLWKASWSVVEAFVSHRGSVADSALVTVQKQPQDSV